MIRTTVLQEWNGLKVKFNQLAPWPKTFPNQQPQQVQGQIRNLNEQINSLRSQVSTWQSNYNTAQANYNSVNSQLSPLRISYNTANETIQQKNVQISSLTNQLNTWTNMFPSKNAGQIKEALNEGEKNNQRWYELYVKHLHCSEQCERKHCNCEDCSKDGERCCCEEIRQYF